MKYSMLHTCLRVMDLEKSLAFYKNALGFRETKRRDFPEHEFTLVFLTDESGHYEIELTYNYNPEKPYVIGNGFSHLAVGTSDLEASHKNHELMGYKVSKLMGLPGEEPRYYFVTDPDGYEVEVIRRA
ncbi:MAG: VOC family protein [Bacillota bacterium]|nr:VOC family protein [Bacillota bacterium]